MNAPLIQAPPEYSELLITDPQECMRIIEDRRARRIDRYDEVWDGVYVMSPIANNEHQGLAGLFFIAISKVIDMERDQVFPGTNVSDRSDDWTRSYRVPDVAVFLAGNPAEDRYTHWFGGPDWAAEILSPGDRAREKLGFYAKVGVRELLVVDRDPWALELHRLRENALQLVGTLAVGDAGSLASEVLPVAFRLLAGEPRPQIEVLRPDGTLVGRC